MTITKQESNYQLNTPIHLAKKEYFSFNSDAKSEYIYELCNIFAPKINYTDESIGNG